MIFVRRLTVVIFMVVIVYGIYQGILNGQNAR